MQRFSSPVGVMPTQVARHTNRCADLRLLHMHCKSTGWYVPGPAGRGSLLARHGRGQFSERI